MKHESPTIHDNPMTMREFRTITERIALPGSDPCAILFEAVADREKACRLTDREPHATPEGKAENPPGKSSASFADELYDSLVELEAMQRENPESAPLIDESLRMLAQLAGDLCDGRWSEGHVKEMMMLKSYSDDMARAAEEAELRGRNAAIDDYKKSHMGDGVPALGGSAPTAIHHRPSIFDIASMA